MLITPRAGLWTPGRRRPPDALSLYAASGVAALIDTPLTYEHMESVGAGLGTGGFIVYDDRTDPIELAGAVSRFLSVESCGQCNACKLGTGAITAMLQRIDAGEGTETDLEEIRKRCITVTDQNRCYLPVGEQLMVGSTMDAFEPAFRAHLGTPCPSDRQVTVPKIVSIDENSGEVVYDTAHARKRPDWSYADQ